jgi:hypothetical protein
LEANPSAATACIWQEDEQIMTVLDVYLNDRKLCRAGVGRDGVLDAIVSWVKLTGPAQQTARRLKKPAEEARLHVGGLRDDVHRVWSAHPLRFGDRVAVVLNRASQFDPPVSEKRNDPKQVERQQRRYFQRLKLQFEKPKARPARRAAEETTRFLNVDLDIWSQTSLDSLVKAFGKNVIVLFAGKEGRRYGAHLELSMQSDNADQLLRRFVMLVDRLPRSARRLWSQARIREFNVGIQAASKPHSFVLGLQPDTLAAAARVNARIGVTVYGAT